MVDIVLYSGEMVNIKFADSDGCISVRFGPEALIVTADMPDQQGREGVIYREPFGMYAEGLWSENKGEPYCNGDKRVVNVKDINKDESQFWDELKTFEFKGETYAVLQYKFPVYVSES